jgi:surface-anchored protein
MRDLLMIRNWIVPLARTGYFIRFATAGACAVLSASALAAPFHTTGHADVRFTYDAATGTADIAYYLDEYSIVGGAEIRADNPMGGTPVATSGGQTKIVFQPSELITYIPDPPIIIPEELEDMLAFTGAQGGDPLWNIPFTQEPDKPWTGISTEAVSSSDFSNIRYQLTTFSGPGHMSLLQWGPFGEPLLEIQTSNGLSSEDAIDVPANTHAHYEWLFTEPGTYAFELTAIGTRTPAAGGGTVSVADTFTFKVVVPEPASATLLVFACGGLLVFRRRQIG